MTVGPTALISSESGVAGLPISTQIQPLYRKKMKLKVSPATAFWLLIVAILVVPIFLFLSVAFSPKLLSQGNQWFTVSSFGQIIHGPFLHAITNSFIVGIITALVSAAIGLGVSFIVLRTDAPLRRVWSTTIFALLLAPSYLIALGWQRIIEPAGVLEVFGFHATSLRQVFYGPVGIILVLTVKGIPFSYLVISNAMRSLGGEFEQAARVHGGSKFDAFRMMSNLLMPAIWSAIAIVFAEAISDFGVAATLSSASHFPVATYSLYNAIEGYPAQFPIAAAVSWILLLLIVIALLLQWMTLRGRSYRVLSGRTRPVQLHQLTVRGKLFGSGTILFTLLATLGIPAFGAVSASLIGGLGSPFDKHSWGFSNYIRVIHSSTLHSPLLFSARMALITATAAMFLAAIVAKMLTAKKINVGSQILDFILLAAVALPGIVFAAGYIFAYNLPFTNHIGLHLYGTTLLLILAYLAGALPATSRSLVGNMSQLHESMSDACRVHGSSAIRTWFEVVMPVVAKPLVAAWLLTYSGTLLELPISQLLYPAGHEPISVGIDKALHNYDFGGGTAMEVLGILSAIVVVGIAYGLFKFLAPTGWKKIGVTV